MRRRMWPARRAAPSWRHGRRCARCSCAESSLASAQPGSERGKSVGAEGKTYPSVTSVIEPDRVAAFARAIGADPADGVPPTFAAVYSLGVTAPQLFGDTDAAIDFAKLLHAEHEFEWSRHPLPGETVSS